MADKCETFKDAITALLSQADDMQKDVYPGPLISRIPAWEVYFKCAMFLQRELDEYEAQQKAANGGDLYPETLEIPFPERGRG